MMFNLQRACSALIYLARWYLSRDTLLDGAQLAALSCLIRGHLSLNHNKFVNFSDLWNLSSLLNCLDGRCLALHRHLYIHNLGNAIGTSTVRSMIRFCMRSSAQIILTSTIPFRDQKYGDFDNLLHGLCRKQFLRNHFDTSHNLPLDL